MRVYKRENHPLVGEGARAQISVHFLIIPKKQRIQREVAKSQVELSVEQRAGVSQTYTHLDVVLTS